MVQGPRQIPGEPPRDVGDRLLPQRGVVGAPEDCPLHPGPVAAAVPQGDHPRRRQLRYAPPHEAAGGLHGAVPEGAHHPGSEARGAHPGEADGGRPRHGARAHLPRLPLRVHHRLAGAPPGPHRARPRQCRVPGHRRDKRRQLPGEAVEGAGRPGRRIQLGAHFQLARHPATGARPPPAPRRARAVAHHGGRSLRHRQGLLRAPRDLRLRLRHLGRREPRALLQDVDVRGHPGDRAVLPRGPHLPQALPLQVALGSQRSQEELHPPGRGLARRVQEVLLREDRLRPGRLRRRERAEEAAGRPGLQVVQVVPGERVPGAVRARRCRCFGRGSQLGCWRVYLPRLPCTQG